MYPVWHYAITRTQAEHLESIQKRAFMLFILLLGACLIIINCLLLNLPPLIPVEAIFQGHSFQISASHPLPPSFTSPSSMHLSFLDSVEQPHGPHVLSHVSNNCSAVAEMGDRLATIDINRKVGGCSAPLLVEGEATAGHSTDMEWPVTVSLVTTLQDKR